MMSSVLMFPPRSPTRRPLSRTRPVRLAALAGVLLSACAQAVPEGSGRSSEASGPSAPAADPNGGTGRGDTAPEQADRIGTATPDPGPGRDPLDAGSVATGDAEYIFGSFTRLPGDRRLTATVLPDPEAPSDEPAGRHFVLLVQPAQSLGGRGTPDPRDAAGSGISTWGDVRRSVQRVARDSGWVLVRARYAYAGRGMAVPAALEFRVARAEAGTPGDTVGR